ncbi:hypothetical protein DF223_08955 [Mycetocola zhujimingii]|uniref:DUF4878 domain-containing protein n=2 Tax=Mycetocola zhujimingii TaxID=2079792 RepID=A0A2U1TDY7_9MICO|nr:hypothetical protein DF223_08955 [Mycetocola zhujimingii]
MLALQSHAINRGDMTNDNTGQQNPWGQPAEPNPWGQPQPQPPQPGQQPVQPHEGQSTSPAAQQPNPHQGQPAAPQPTYPPQQPNAASQPSHPQATPAVPALPVQQPASPTAAPQFGQQSQPTPPGAHQGAASYPQQAPPVAGPSMGQPAGGAGYPPQPPTAAYPAGAPSTPPAPRKKKSLVPWIAGGTAVLLLGIGGAVAFGVGSSAHAPELEVKAYLDALKKGDVSGAFEVSDTKVEKTDLLLTKKAYADVDDRITRYTLGDVSVEGDTATVTASITQAGEKYDQEFTLVKQGKDAVFFDNWQLESPPLSSIAVGINAPDDAVVEVAGVDISELKKDDGVYTLRVLPGTYPIALGGESDWYSAEEVSASVVGFGVEAEAAEAPTLEIALTEEGTTAATDAVNAWLDACVASTDLAPAGCPFWATNSEGYELSNFTWTVTRPTFTIGEFADGTWPVSTDTDGSAQAGADARDPLTGATGPIATDSFPFDVDGYVEAFGEDGATFVYVP